MENPSSEKIAPLNPPKLRLAIVGGGRRCQAILQRFDTFSLELLGVEIVGVADLNPEAEGLKKAARRGIFTTADFHDLLTRKAPDLILELTDNEEMIRKITQHKPASAGIIDHNAFPFFNSVLSLNQELIENQDEISNTRSLAQAMTEATSEAAMILDLDYHILQINDGACRQSGITAEGAKGRFCFQITHQSAIPCHSLETPCPMVETVMTGKSAHTIHEHKDAEGKSHFCDVSTFPLTNRRGEVVQVLEIVRDITNDLSARIEQKTRTIKEDLARLVREDKLISLGKLVASVAHEINNPIGSILNFTKLIHKIILDHRPTAKELSDFKKWLDLTVREAQRCRTIVGKLLSFARQQSLETTLFDLRELLEQMILLTTHQMELSHIKLDTSRLSAQPLFFWGDQTQIQQCLSNLIFNALESMPKGGTLTIRGDRNLVENEIWVEIMDTGIGIPPENLPYIFDPFFSTKKESSGVGLGLSLVYGIIAEHGGRVEVDSQPGRGSTFRIFLPCWPRRIENRKQSHEP
jgi:two-component system NtrC family sensor kinase